MCAHLHTVCAPSTYAKVNGGPGLEWDCCHRFVLNRNATPLPRQQPAC